ncbi:hypothetical protein PIB30_089727 [Stylosanthes scabra]|uniref:Uncharacterized protein n=1 Tax=Stylosanthes scabra TaxID=79078 RepID=A0ABU6VT85_9FABA|nr:hypothetical protein [Stylosanthes scabra]
MAHKYAHDECLNPNGLMSSPGRLLQPNPTGPVLVPDHYRTHFPEDNSLNAPTVYGLSHYHIYLGGQNRFQDEGNRFHGAIQRACSSWRYMNRFEGYQNRLKPS